MKRSDIRNTTLLLMAFTVVAFALIWIFRRLPEIETGSVESASRIAWSDTLSNESSQWEALAPLDSQIERFMSKWSINGLSLAVTRNDSLLYAKGYGWADKEAGLEMTPASIMRIASASKLVTGIAVMRLVEQKKLSLQSRVFGPEGILNDTSYTNAVKDPRHFDITVDHLLRHQGGFSLRAGDPMFNTAELIAAKNLQGPPSPEKLVQLIISRRLAFNPGSGHIYSNFGYFLLSQVIERVSGKSYWQQVSESVLIPSQAYRFRPATNYYGERHAGEVKYYGPDNELIPEFNGSGRMVDRVYGGNDITGLQGAGGWVTTASDLARLVAAVDKHPAVPDILSAASVDSMTYAADKDKRVRGWADSDGNGKWTRTGTLGSTHAFVRRFPDGECWVLITNTGVWTGHHFSNEMGRLVDRLRQQYSEDLPSRNLW